MDEIALKIFKIDARREALRRGFTFTVSAMGVSMLPMVRSKDKVVIAACDKEKLRLGDLIIYQKNANSHIMAVHRIVRKIKNRNGYTFITKGDTLRYCDRPIDADMVIGRVAKIKKPYFTISLDTFAGYILNLVMLAISMTGFIAFGLQLFNKLKYLGKSRFRITNPQRG